MIDHPAFNDGVAIGRPEPATWMLLRVATQPGPQRRIGVGCRGCGLVSLSRTGLPGNPAGESLADPQLLLEMTNGRPPTFRA